MIQNSNKNDRRDELLEVLWRLEEFYEMTTSQLQAHDPAGIYQESLQEFSTNGIIRVTGSQIQFTDHGRDMARGIIRRHRLAERLLVDVLNKTNREVEDAACEFEHLLAPELVDAICTILGHPQVCPHGIAIPEGPCCREDRRSVERVAVPISQLKVGDEGRIAFINTTDMKRMNKLLSMGLSPGVRVRLQQRYPACVVSVDNNNLAFDQAISQEIQVWMNPQ
ncbi:MAG: metal-dependent transcriptional regulator [Magnetococcales bacterium]|nr:metal-dependent transcriptional regulator [Magnetococcales bacterium]